MARIKTFAWWLVIIAVGILAGCAGEPSPAPAKPGNGKEAPLGPPPPPANPVLLQPASGGPLGIPPMPPAVSA